MIGRPKKKRSETSTGEKERSQMKAPSIAHRNLPRFLGALAAVAVLILALGVGSASAQLAIENFDGETITESGEAATQAGSHPYASNQEIDFTFHEVPGFCFPLCKIPDGAFKDVQVKLPAGFTGNPNAVPKCPLSTFLEGTLVFEDSCPNNTVIGTTELKGNFFLPLPSRVINLQPAPGEPATFGFRALTAAVVLHASIRTGDDYGTTITIPNSSQGLPVIGTELAFWGVPGDSSHNGERGGPFEGSVRPFLSNPTSCSGPLLTKLRVNSWEEPNNYQEASFFSHDSADNPVGIEGCDKLSFEPSLNLQSEPPSAASTTALSATVHLPQHNEDPSGLVTAHLKKSVVRLPQGVAVNPAAASGRGACTEAQFGLDNNNPVSCPSDSRIGVGEIVSPLLAKTLTGSIYLAQQNANPFGSLLAIYYIVEAEGVKIKLAGHVETDPVTGQITTTFDNNPQLPFSEFHLDFFGGPRGVLVNPNGCGNQTYSATFTAWSGATVNTTGSFDINQNCSTGGFNPGLSAGSTNPVGGTYAPFAFNVTRKDGEQNVSAIGVTLPKGEVAKIAGVPLCPEANAATGSCPASSQVGSVAIAAGAGSEPVWVPQPGKAPTAAYLGGPYKGDPYSLIFRVPVQAGPFDLGTVVTRAAISVNPDTAQVSVSSDPLPQILQGIPIGYRQVHIGIDRAGFTLNPTNCTEQAVASTIVSAQGATATPASRFQVTDCGTLGYKPKLFTRIWGKTNRGAHPKFRAVLEPRKGDANVGRTALTLPRSEFLDQAHIKTICTRVQFAAGACPAASVYGSAKARTPLFDQPFEGPVYLRSSNHKLPDLVAALHGPVDFNLVARIDSKNKGIRNTFEAPPDVPVSKFTLYMKGGQKGLLVNSRNICNATYRSNANLRGQNGRRQTQKPVLKNSKCKGKKK
jgi:hypothetical protein